MKCRGGAHGSVDLVLDPAEADLLRDVPEQLRGLYEAPSDDPALQRLFPRAYLDPTEDRAEREWQALTHPELLRQRLERLDRVLGTLDRSVAKGRRLKVALGPEDVAEWLAVLNDARLAFGSRLGITEDSEVHRIEADDPLGLEKAAYAWLTMLQGVLVEALLETAPD
ncbi:MAG: DUF2017 family protein [Actinomycetota bacterium]